MIDRPSSAAPPLYVWALTVLVLMLVLAAFAAAFMVVDDPFQWLLVSNGFAHIG
jgi:hypothetical protein